MSGKTVSPRDVLIQNYKSPVPSPNGAGYDSPRATPRDFQPKKPFKP